jgi:hypothetical protein
MEYSWFPNRCPKYRKERIMNNTPTSYEDYIMQDKEYRIDEYLYELRLRYIDSIDRDDMDYPPTDWESGL